MVGKAIVFIEPDAFVDSRFVPFVDRSVAHKNHQAPLEKLRIAAIQRVHRFVMALGSQNPHVERYGPTVLVHFEYLASTPKPTRTG